MNINRKKNAQLNLLRLQKHISEVNFKNDISYFLFSWQLFCHLGEFSKVGNEIIRQWIGGIVGVKMSNHSNLIGYFRPMSLVRESKEDENRLEKVYIKVIEGFVFVCLNPKCEDIGQAFEPFLEILQNYRVSELQLLSNEITETEIQANWRSVVEISLDDEHVPYIHPEFSGMMRGALGYQVNKSVRTWHQPLGKCTQSRLGKLYLTLANSLHKNGLNLRWTYFWVFPGLEIELYPEQVIYYQLIPIEPFKTLKRSVRLSIKSANIKLKCMQIINAIIQSRIDEQDLNCINQRQKVLTSIVDIPLNPTKDDRLVQKFYDCADSFEAD